MEYGESLAAQNSNGRIWYEEIIIIDDLELILQFNELLILLDLITAHQHQLGYRNKFIQYRVEAIITAPELIENLYFMTQEDVTQLERLNLSYK